MNITAKQFIAQVRGQDYRVKTRLEALYWAFGWQGGTIHQLANETGLTVEQLLDIDNNKFYDSHLGHGLNSAYIIGMCVGTDCSIKFNYDVNFSKIPNKGNEQFWQGVANGIFNHN